MDNSSLSQQTYPEAVQYDVDRISDSNTDDLTSLALFSLSDDDSNANNARLPEISKTFDNFAAFSPYSVLSHDNFEATPPHFQEFDPMFDEPN